MHAKTIPEPWKSFLGEIDAQLTETVEFHCLGGFVVEIIYGLKRTTSTGDIDTLSITPTNQRAKILEIAGRNSKLYEKYRIYVGFVTVSPTIYNYGDRLQEAFQGLFKNLKVMALDPYDVALAKIERNSQKDRDDVKLLAGATPFDLQVLKKRFEDEVKPYLGNPDRESLTLALWIEMIEEDRAK